MLPHDAQGIIAKIVFFVFATLVLCFSKARAHSVETYSVTPSYSNVVLK